VAADAQVRAAGLVGTATQPGLGEVAMLAGVFGDGHVLPAPGIGEHTEEVLASL
jgi:hypothetical protein